MLFSVIMPTYRRLDVLRRVLAAWEVQDPVGLDFEVVVVDDGSGDGTTDFLAQWRPRRYGYRFATQPNAGPAAARNRALSMASGDHVLFVGDDIEPTPDLLHQHWRAHRQLDDPTAAVLGLTRWPNDAPLTATMRHIDGVGAQQFSYHFMEDGAEYDFRHLYTSNVSLRRDLIRREVSADGQGPFSTAFPAAAFEDAELGDRLARHGMRIVYRRAAVALHHHPYTAAGFFRRQVRCGAMADVLYRMRPELRNYLDLDILEDLRFHLEPARPSLDTAVRQTEARALRVAAFFDPLPFDAVDCFLRPLFRYAYLRGLADARYGAALGLRLAHALGHKLLMPAAEELGAALACHGLPTPTADLLALQHAGYIH